MSDTLEATLAARREQEADLAHRDARIANRRLALAIIGGISAVLCLGGDPRWLLLTGAASAAFMAFAVHHATVLGRLQEATAAVRYFERLTELARDGGALPQSAGRTNTEIDDPTHGDLDLVGAGSVFDLLSTAHTLPGRTLAAHWLLHGSDRDALRMRQEAARDLADREPFREALWIAGHGSPRSVDPEGVLAWAGEAIPPSKLHLARIPAWLFTIATSTLVVAAMQELPGARQALQLTVLAHLGFYAWIRTRTRPILDPLQRAAKPLEAYRRLIACTESESFSAARLTALRATLSSEAGNPDGSPASRRASVAIRGLRRLAEFVESLANPFVALFIAPLGFLDLHCALALQRWRVAHGAHIPGWLAAVAEVEALAGIGALAASRPSMHFPEIAEGAPTFEAEGLAHPLLPATERIANDVALGEPRRLLLVSGSNMSGKSTLLRSVGVAARMALAGAPVCAKSLRITPMELCTSIRVADSLAQSSSHFHQEVLRLKESLDLATGARPLLYLFDEILHGTNSRERAIGARALVRRLVEEGALGLVTTHDLAVTELADELGDRAENVHFSDQVEEGRMIFDYRMRPGVVQTTNAIRLMRQVGIDLPYEDPVVP